MSSSIIKVSQAAELLNVSPHYVRKLLREGKVEGQQDPVSGRWTVVRSSLEQYRTTDLYQADLNDQRIELNISIQDAVQVVEEAFDCDVLSYIANPGIIIDQNDAITIDNLLYKFKDRAYAKGASSKPYKRVALILHSGGGILEAAIKLVGVIRHYADEFIVIVPIMAKSAATAVSLMADECYLTSLSELGPVDPMVQNPNDPRQLIPATAIDNLLASYKKPAETTETAKDASQLDPLIERLLEQKIDVFLLGAYKTALNFSKQTIERALKEHSMHGAEHSRIIEAVDEFTAKYDSHSYPIMFDTLEKFGIGKLMSDSQLESIKTLMSAYQAIMVNSGVVKIIGNQYENFNLLLPSNPVAQAQQFPTRTSF